MIKMKKISVLFWSAVLCCPMIFGVKPVYAAGTVAEKMDEKTQNIINENDAYIADNLDVLLERALQNHINTTDCMKASSLDVLNVTDLDEDYSAVSCVIQDTELQRSDKDDSVLCALTTASAVMPRASSGNKSENTTDSTVSVKAYSTIYYNKKVSNNITFYCLTKVTGKYEILDSSIQVKSQNVKYAMTGHSETSYLVDKHGEFNPSGSSWSKSTGFTEYCDLSTYGVFGSTYTLKIGRASGNQWTFSLQNRL